MGWTTGRHPAGSATLYVTSWASITTGSEAGATVGAPTRLLFTCPSEHAAANKSAIAMDLRLVVSASFPNCALWSATRKVHCERAHPFLSLDACGPSPGDMSCFLQDLVRFRSCFRPDRTHQFSRGSF